jgi:16S rRNA processing protein RimM
MSAGDVSPPLIELGSVGAPFGVRGWIKVRSFTDPPERVFGKRSLWLVHQATDAVEYQIESTGRSGGQLTAKLHGVDDRDQARSLTGSRIVVRRDELPPSDDRDFYQADLIGCDVMNHAGLHLGVLRYFVETPAHTMMVVQGDREFWVPAVPKHLQRVDLAARQVIVNWDVAAE